MAPPSKAPTTAPDTSEFFKKKIKSADVQVTMIVKATDLQVTIGLLGLALIITLISIFLNFKIDKASWVGQTASIFSFGLIASGLGISLYILNLLETNNKQAVSPLSKDMVTLKRDIVYAGLGVITAAVLPLTVTASSLVKTRYDDYTSTNSDHEYDLGLLWGTIGLDSASYLLLAYPVSVFAGYVNTMV